MADFYRRMDYKLVEVTWLDAWSDEAHLEEGALVGLAPIDRRNVGFLMRDDEAKVIITQGIINNLFAGKTFMDGIVVIPRGMIKAIRVLND